MLDKASGRAESLKKKQQNRRGRKPDRAGRGRPAVTIAAAARFLAALAGGTGDVRGALGRIPGRRGLHLSSDRLRLHRHDDDAAAAVADGRCSARSWARGRIGSTAGLRCSAFWSRRCCRPRPLRRSLSPAKLEVWHLAVSCFINGTAWASDNAVRRILIGDVVGADRMATAMALDIGANNASRMMGPAIGGVLLASCRRRGAVSVERRALPDGDRGRSRFQVPQNCDRIRRQGPMLSRDRRRIAGGSPQTASARAY